MNWRVHHRCLENLRSQVLRQKQYQRIFFQGNINLRTTKIFSFQIKHLVYTIQPIHTRQILLQGSSTRQSKLPIQKIEEVKEFIGCILWLTMICGISYLGDVVFDVVKSWWVGEGDSDCFQVFIRSLGFGSIVFVHCSWEVHMIVSHVVKDITINFRIPVLQCDSAVAVIIDIKK